MSDRLGSSALVLDRSGSVLVREAHLPYGEPWFSWTDGDTRAPEYRFTGKERESLSKSTAIGVRHYLPAIGRWASPDSLFVQHPALLRERPGERNLYRYAAHEPISNVDPDGRSVWTKLVKIGAKVLRGASAAEAFADNVKDVRTLADAQASTSDRVVAGLSLASEVLPLSIGDAKTIAKWGRKALREAPSRGASAAARRAKRAGKLASSIKWKGFAKGSEARHFQKHGAEFGDITQGEYKRRAKGFAAEEGDFREQAVGNFVVKYDPATRRTLVGHAKKREIRTFYKADGRDADPFAAAVKLATDKAD